MHSDRVAVLFSRRVIWHAAGHVAPSGRNIPAREYRCSRALALPMRFGVADCR
ncbi:MAG: hypothetical protein OES79_03890 [Planctomycetota bacterium]|nr:hypothetical protein [Planctomycetota bacterium]